MLKKLKTAYPIFTQNFTYKYGINLYIRTKMTNVLPWPVSKKPKLENEAVVKDDVDKNLEKPKIPRVKKRMFALVVAYCGQGYFGLQRNFGHKTIEEEIMIALKNIGVVNEEEFKRQQSIYFQRAARTDKGVSALRQMISLEMREDVKPEDINTHLPEQIRVLAVQRVTKGFNSKNSCDSRTYSYTCPTFAFAPKDTPISDDYRISPEILEKLNEPMKSFIGTRNFHNFTSGRRSQDPSCKRFLIDIYYRPPFVREDLELITFIIKGQSFMLHQIRKMMGTLMVISAGYFPPDYILKAYDENEKLEIPIAPGVGLLLEQVHYDWYNNKYGQDGFHQKLDFVDIEPMVEEFREKYINPAIIKAEKEERSMKNWLEDMRVRALEEKEVNAFIKNAQQNESSVTAEDTDEKTLNDETDKNQMENVEQNNTDSVIVDGDANDIQKSSSIA